MQVGPYPGQILDDVDADRAKVRRRADPGQHQQLCRADAARGQHDLAGADPDELGANAVVDADAARVLDPYAVHQRVGHDLEVGAVQCGGQVGVGGALALPVDDVQIGAAESFLEPAADVACLLVAGLRGCLEARRYDLVGGVAGATVSGPSTPRSAGSRPVVFSLRLK